VVAIADGAAAVLTSSRPAFWPFSLVAVALTLIGMAAGCRRDSEGPALPPASPGNLALGVFHMMHWFVVIPWVTLKMALLPKKLVWAKTAHGELMLNSTSYAEYDLTTQGLNHTPEEEAIIASEGGGL
jgi:1,2-diacylglycerol 3-beta-glucosyltransferase